MNSFESSVPAASEFLELPPLPAARVASSEIRAELDAVLSAKMPKYASEDTSFVVFGSLAIG